MKEYEKQHRIFYVFLRNLVAFLLLILNGKSKYYNVDRIPKDENYILVAPHRMAWEPVWFAFATRPKQFIFMAKKELFKGFGVGGLKCVVPFQLTAKIQELSL